MLSISDAGNIDLIRRSGLRYREEQDAQIVRFVFEPGQECFAGRAGGHRIPIERDPIFQRDRSTMEPLEWMDRMNDSLYRLQQEG